MKRLLLILLVLTNVSLAGSLSKRMKTKIHYVCLEDKWGFGFVDDCGPILSRCVNDTYMIVNVYSKEYGLITVEQKEDESFNLCISDMK